MRYRSVLCGLLLGALCVLLSRPLLVEASSFDDVITDDDSQDVSDQDGGQDITVNVEIDYSAITDAILAALEDRAASEAAVASLDDESYDGSISTTYQSLFAATYLKFAGINDDYLVYRGGQYDYYLLIGNLTLASTTFTGDDVTIVHYYVRSGTSSGYTYSPEWEVYTDSVNVTADQAYSYSNLGDYAPLQDLAWLKYQMIIIFLFVFAGLMFFVDSIVHIRSK